MNTTKDISIKLSQAIRQSGMTQTELAQKIGVSQQQISSYMKKHSLPSLDMLSRLCTVLDLDANEILCVERPKDY
ncbi:MAG: helix-turn-helix transcriptional regulator [Clostridiales bacterium]|nr:helix-turn-helix transcriptional regulator [Clostridiales bacterium]